MFTTESEIPDASAVDDRTASARIRDEAMALFAAHGPDGVPLRRIAQAADVSAALIIHHFESKAGLTEAVNNHVANVVTDLLAPLLESSGDPDAFSGVSAMLRDAFNASPHLLGYLRHLLIDGGPQAEQLFAQLQHATVDVINELQSAGLVCSTHDPDLLAAFLIANDLAVVLLGDLITATTKVNPLSDGLDQWSVLVLDVYARGLFVPPTKDVPS